MGKLIDELEIGSQPIGRIGQLLAAYAAALRPWAIRVASQMIGEVEKKDRQAWHELGSAISEQLHSDLRRSHVGAVMYQRLGENVKLITSIPQQAAERVHELTLAGLVTSTRAREVAEEIRRTTEVTKSRATLIARTEVARTAAALTQARAESAGSTHYIWRTAGDSDVRPGHKAMAGRTFEWANPPPVDENGRVMYHHPGEIWNCRCYAEPILPDPYTPVTPARRRRFH